MSKLLKPMDVYATHLVPFDIAAYCRGHRFSPQAVALAKAVRDYDKAKEAFAAAEQRMEDAQNTISAAHLDVRKKMENDSHA